jgi:hypothetical protein
MSEIAARTPLTTTVTPPGRPGFRRSIFWTCLAGAVGVTFGTLALQAPALVGVGTFPHSPNGGGGLDWYAPTTAGAALADAAALVVVLWACTLTVRSWLVSFSPVLHKPAWTWTALTLTPAAVAVVAGGVKIQGTAVVAALVLRLVAYRADGSVRPDPLTPRLSRRARIALGLAIPVAAIGVATPYATHHPLRALGNSNPGPIVATTKPLVVDGPTLSNEGGRPVRILAIEPGEERGFALHVTNVGIYKRMWQMGEKPTVPFHPFTLAPHATRAGLQLTISRAGCRPGATGRIDSVRVRYDVGGPRSTLLKLEQPLTLRC